MSAPVGAGTTETMDFALGDVQLAVREAAEAVFSPRSATRNESGRARTGDDWFDHQAWTELGESGLLGLLVPTEFGGAGYGILEACTLLQSQGAHLVRVPLLESSVAAAGVLSQWGTDEQQAELLPDLAVRSSMIVPAMTEPLNLGIDAVGCTAVPDGSGWILDGIKTCVPLTDWAARLLIPALLNAETPAVFIIDPCCDGVLIEAQTSTTGRPEARLTLRGVRCSSDDIIGGLGDATAAAHSLEQIYGVGVAALQLGVVEQALALTSTFVSERHQFGHPIATFQGVAMRAADAFIDVSHLRTSLWFTAWQLAEGHGATDDLDVTLAWACDGGARVIATAHHLHGGTGVDLDYPLAQYTTWAKANELAAGGGSRRIASLGARMGDRR